MPEETAATLFAPITATDNAGVIYPCGLRAVIVPDTGKSPGTSTAYYCSIYNAWTNSFCGHTAARSFLPPGPDVPREAPSGHAGGHAGPGRPRLWPSNADRQRAYRKRQKKAGA